MSDSARFADLEALARELDREALARIMVGHRELFHSNLLGWLFEVLPDIADRVFPTSLPGPGSPREAVRELQNLDLVLVRPGVRPIVIENKVFSVPSRSQLDEYDAKLARWWDRPARRVLLAMTQPLPPLPPITAEPEPDSWVFWSYADLADALDEALLQGTDDYELETMRRYARVVRLLHRMIDMTRVRHEDEPVFLPPEILARMPARQLRQGIEKMRAQHVAAMVSGLASDRIADGEMSRGLPIVSVRRRTPGEPEVYEHGVQLQAGQVRKYLVTRAAGRGTEAKGAREQLATSRPELVSLTAIHGVLGTQLSDEQPGYKHFDPNFVYRYVRAPGITVRQLVSIMETL